MALDIRIRSLLFAPAVRPDLVRKMPTTGADAIVIDLEDATPPANKAEGRETLRVLVDELAGQVPIFARVNDPSTPWHHDDLQMLPARLDGVVLPKIETTEALDRFAAELAACVPPMAVIGGIETARGVEAAPELIAHSRVDAAYFGAEDYIADLGGIRTPSNTEVLYARSRVAMAGAIAQTPVIDQIVADFRDDQRCRAEAAEARSLGFRGKLCIHPAQVAIVNDVFTPTEAEVDRSRRLLAAYAQAQANGVASIAFEGQMVDEPVAVQARRVIADAGEPGC